LDWEKKLILKPLLDRSLKINELLEHEFVRETIKESMPEIAFGSITNKILSQKEVKQRLQRQVRTLRKRGVLLLDDEGRYFINLLLHGYFSSMLADETPQRLRRKAMRYASALRKEYRHWLVPIESIDLKQMMKKYDEFLNKTKEVRSNLRFGVPFIKVSDIAQQFYCEKHIELEYQYGRPATEAMETGEEAHERLLEGVKKVSREKVFERIASGTPILIHEMLLCTYFRNVPVVGIADAVLFDGARPVFLFEFKFPKVPIPRAHHHVQAQLYCLLLRELGFDTSALNYVLVLAPPGSKNQELAKLVCSRVAHATMLEPRMRIASANVIIRKFDSKSARQSLAWGIDFWLNNRKAKPTSKQEKCAHCYFRSKCDAALVK
jgi:CRISPR/Cas system-associated exonuclease Cas4 (RecB family)